MWAGRISFSAYITSQPDCRGIKDLRCCLCLQTQLQTASLAPERTLVGVMLQSKLPVRSLELGIARVGINAKDFVVPRAVALLPPATESFCSREATAAKGTAKGKASAEHFRFCCCAWREDQNFGQLRGVPLGGSRWSRAALPFFHVRFEPCLLLLLAGSVVLLDAFLVSLTW